jgi:D-galacturonate reductase
MDKQHLEIALYAIERGLHVLVTKPPVKTVADHLKLIEAADRSFFFLFLFFPTQPPPFVFIIINIIYIRKEVLVSLEVHKRWDQIYADAREKIRSQLGDFSFFNSFMSQPKHQLKTFRAWAGTSSDISYYLNSHHVDYLCWALEGIARPTKVTAMASTGVATAEPWKCVEGTEDTITLMVQWENNSSSGSRGSSVHTSSWSASSKVTTNDSFRYTPLFKALTLMLLLLLKAEVHSQQRFFYMGHKGEIRIDQAHRGFEMATDDHGYSSVNPLFMKYTPDAWVDACLEIKSGRAKAADFESTLPTISTTLLSTGILEAGRKSLDQGGIPVTIDEATTEAGAISRKRKFEATD